MVSFVVRPINGKMTMVRKDEAARPRSAVSDLPAPMIISDRFDKPVMSMASGQLCESRSELRRTYRPDGNPQGKTYVEVGEEDITHFEPPKRDRKADRDAIERAISDVESGNAPPVLTTDMLKA